MPKRYIYDRGIDRPLARVAGSVTSYFIADHLGSVLQETDTSGVPTLTRNYDPWGRLIEGSSTSGYAFTGREWEPEINLYYYRARFYDPLTGRFLSEDPLGDLNLYAYVGGSPLNHTDPFGLIKTKGFSKEHEQKMQEGAKRVEQKLREDPCCTVGDPKKLLRLMDEATFVYKPDIADKKGKTRCGEVSNPIRWLQKRIHIGKTAFDAECGPPECTILHEVTHLSQASRDESEPYRNEFCCFGCGDGEVPQE